MHAVLPAASCKSLKLKAHFGQADVNMVEHDKTHNFYGAK